MIDYCLAHLSDLHLGPLPPFRWQDWNIKRGLGLLNWHRGRKHQHSLPAFESLLADLRDQAPAHVALTGDLVNLGLPAEHAAAAEWLGTIGPPADVSVVPGNHDIYTPLRRDPGIERWRAYMSGDGGVPGPVAGFPYVRRRGPLLLIGVNSAHPTPPFVAAGELGPRQLDALGDLLRASAGEGFCRCVLIHHPPLPGQAKPRRALTDADRLSEVLRAAGVELVLHGHNHRDMVATFTTAAGPALISGIASGSMAGGGRHASARYAVHRISRTGSGWHVVTERRGLAPDGRVTSLDTISTDLSRDG